MAAVDSDDLRRWATTRNVAQMWWCGDEHCDCTQPIVERITPNSEVGYPWIRRERLWAGPFVSVGGYAPEPGEAEQQWRELLEAAERFKAEKLWRDKDVPASVRPREDEGIPSPS